MIQALPEIGNPAGLFRCGNMRVSAKKSPARLIHFAGLAFRVVGLSINELLVHQKN